LISVYTTSSCDLQFYNFVSAEAASREETDSEDEDAKGTEDITEEAEDSAEEEEEDEMPPKKTTKKTPSTNKKAVPSASKSPVRDVINDVIGGLEGVTLENKWYSFTVLDPYKVHPYVKSDVYVVLGEVFTNPVPEDMIRIDLSNCGTKVLFYRANYEFVGSHAHFKADKESDLVVYDQNSSKAVAHANTTQLIRKEYKGKILDGKIWPDTPMEVPLPMKCVGQPYSVRFRHYPTGHTVRFEMELPRVREDPVTGIPRELISRETVDIPVMQMKVEFRLEGEKRREVAKGKVKKMKAISIPVSQLVDDDDSSAASGMNV
jgi:hypothetical protein